jgi:alkylation response protein AidB-like acyl-CoA dehydrogenase
MPPSPLDTARKLAPLIRASADAIDAARELPRPLFEALADAGLYRMLLPRSLGGLELDLPDYVPVMEELGKADASTAWTINQGGVFAAFGSPRLPPEVARLIWTDTPRSVVCNTPIPSARADVVPGGYRVTGKMGFSTGCRHASWMASYAQIFRNDQPRLDPDGKPEARYLMLPIAEAEVIDTWEVNGMRGTGTHHIEVKNVFVPEARTYQRNDPPREQGPLYQILTTVLYGTGDTAVALGMARACVDTFGELAGSKTPRAMQALLRDQSMIQFNVGQCEAAIRSGRAFLVEAVGNLWHEVTTTGATSQDRRAELRLAITHGIRLACQAVDIVYNAAGASAVLKSSLIQRHFQDMHVITQHIQARQAYYEMVGKHWLGLPVSPLEL